VAEVVAAAKAAGAHDFITELPDGFDTEVGHGGSGLSGGQRQRLGIARVLLRDPAILLLDEPTSGLDAASEADVLDGLEILMQGRTTIIVTHSESLARSVDRVVVMEDGRLVQCGPPADLLSQVGPFRRIGESHRRLASRRTPAPRDSAIPGLRSLLDPEEMAPVLERSLGNGRGVREVRLFHARIAPGDRMVTGYEALVDGVPRRAVAVASADGGSAHQAGLEANLSRAAAVNGRSPARTPLTFDDEVGALIQWLPLDLWIPACGIRPEELAGHLGHAGDEREPEPESYLPLERAVFRAGERTVTAYASPRQYAWAVTSMRVLGDAARPETPRLLAELPQLLCVVEDEPAGERPDSPEFAAVPAGAALRALHELHVVDLPHVAAADVLSDVARARTEITGCAPLLAPRLANLITALVNNPPPATRLVAAHGGYSVEKLVHGKDGFALRGLHQAGVMSPAADLSSYAAAALDGRPGDADRARRILDDLTYGYGGRPEGLAWYLATAIIRRATTPFREQTRDWPARTQALIAAAEDVARS
jgi:ABC transporter